ncbi:alpha/beta hydrolase [Lactobacillus sp. CRM56-3]|uniref:Alpha/beta hydrolase n=2 Tax=Secundilactobacillus folii TaxID=2678357 RepID=A0A7X2XZ74_9LACO|nr:alpha/beta hydrolase [Secundilactobacillus folii]
MIIRRLQANYIRQNYTTSATPTIFVHGWTGDKHSEQEMVDAAQNSKVARHVMSISVTPTGIIKFKGHLTQREKNPIVEVVFKNNRAGEVQDAMWLKSIMAALRAKYHVTAYNAVGHSMGAYAWVYYNLMVGNDAKQYPELKKAVLIAGPYDGIINNHKLNQPTEFPLNKLWDDRPNANRLLPNGKPKIIHPEYRLLYRMRARFPKQARVLNIYGNLENGTHSDGVISIPSARSLAYLISGRVQEYRDYQVKGPNAQHSRLHQHNFFVDRALINFLWKKTSVR